MEQHYSYHNQDLHRATPVNWKKENISMMWGIKSFLLEILSKNLAATKDNHFSHLKTENLGIMHTNTYTHRYPPTPPPQHTHTDQRGTSFFHPKKKLFLHFKCPFGLHKHKYYWFIIAHSDITRLMLVVELQHQDLRKNLDNHLFPLFACGCIFF